MESLLDNIIDSSTVKKKLKGIGHFLWINLDTEVNRQNHMNALFDEYGIENTRISAIDARGDNDVSDLLLGRFPSLLTQGELGCTMSHLKAIKYFYEQTDLEYIIICEDDIVFDTVPYWPFTWKDFMSKVPYDWDVLQCAITSTKNLRANLHPRLINDFCAAFYVISRHHAAKIIKNHIRGDKFKLDQNIKPRAASEEIIYNSGKTYSLPLFTYRYDFDSGIHQEHIEIFHKQNVEGVLNFWKTRPPELTTESLLDYEFYEFWEPLIGE
jgi:GR25 family glycosyltransferase involved in LPS biosynthesis